MPLANAAVSTPDVSAGICPNPELLVAGHAAGRILVLHKATKTASGDTDNPYEVEGSTVAANLNSVVMRTDPRFPWLDFYHKYDYAGGAPVISTPPTINVWGGKLHRAAPNLLPGSTEVQPTIFDLLSKVEWLPIDDPNTGDYDITLSSDVALDQDIVSVTGTTPRFGGVDALGVPGVTSGSPKSFQVSKRRSIKVFGFDFILVTVKTAFVCTNCTNGVILARECTG